MHHNFFSLEYLRIHAFGHSFFTVIKIFNNIFTTFFVGYPVSYFRRQTKPSKALTKISLKVATQQTFVGLQDAFKTCLEDVFNTSSA